MKTSIPKLMTYDTILQEKVHYPQEKHLKNIRQLTFGGNNAEAYWSFDGTMLTFQSDYAAWGCLLYTSRCV